MSDAMSDLSTASPTLRSSTPRRVHGSILLLLVTTLTIVFATATTGVARAQSGTVQLRLVSVPLSIEQDDSLPIVVSAVGEVPTDGVIVVTAYPPVNSRGDVATIVEGHLPSVSAAAISFPVKGLARDDSGAFVLPIPTQSATRLKTKLRLKDPGLYPLSIELRDSDTKGTLAQLSTFVERLGQDVTPSTVSVGWLFSIDSPPTLQSNGTTVVSDVARTQLSALAGFLQQTTVPISAVIRPELLDGLKRSGTASDLALLKQVAAAFGNQHELLAEPSVSMDPSAAAAAGMQSTFTDQLRLGEDQLVGSLGINSAKRSSWFVPAGTDAAGLALLRGLGVQHVVLGQSAAIPQPVGTPTGEIGKVQLGTDQTIPALITDRTIDASLHAATDDPIATAHLIVADLTALGIEHDRQLTTSAHSPARGVVVSVGLVGSIDPTLLQDVFALLQQSPHIALRTVDGVLSELERGTDVDDMRVIGVSNPSPIDLRSAAFTLGSLNSQISSYATMLTTSDGVDPRPAIWRRLLQVYPADDITNAERLAYANQIGGDLDVLRSSVTYPSLGHITIGGRASDIPFVLDNSSDVDLKVMLRLSSAKMDFLDNDQVITVSKRTSANGRTSTNIRVRARSGAEFPVQVQLFTPDGKQALGPPSTLTVRASVLTGLGQVATGALLVILASWWLQNFMRSRRRRRDATSASIGRHPVKRSVTGRDQDDADQDDAHQDDDTGPNGIIRPQFDDDESGGGSAGRSDSGLDRHDEVGRHDDETRVIVMQSDKVPDS